MHGGFEVDASGIGWIVASHLSAAGYEIMSEILNIAPARSGVTDLARIGCLRMGGRLIRVAVTSGAGTIGLRHKTVIER
jgi:hypothetical protein